MDTTSTRGATSSPGARDPGTGRAPGAGRSTAGERREDILRAAISEFAEHGLHGTSTERIAERAGVSQPYVFRLFGTKKALFLAATDRGCERVMETFTAAIAASPGDHPLHAAGSSYLPLISDRELLLLQMQSYAACGDPEVQARVRDSYRRLYELLLSQPHTDRQMVSAFLAEGMLINVALAVELPELFPDEHLCVHRCDDPDCPYREPAETAPPPPAT